MDTIADKKIKEICWKLDREIWAHVPDGGQSEPWTQSKAREESAKLIYEYFGSVEELRAQVEHLEALLRNRDAYIETLEGKSDCTTS